MPKPVDVSFYVSRLQSIEKMTQTLPQLEFCPRQSGFYLRPSLDMAERGARPFEPYPGDLENADLFNTDGEFRAFLMLIAHHLFIRPEAKLTVEAMTYAALVRMEGADNIAPERVADAMRDLQRATI
jgi:hypothetical protein